MPLQNKTSQEFYTTGADLCNLHFSKCFRTAVTVSSFQCMELSMLILLSKVFLDTTNFVVTDQFTN
jgi:hypothetical protein